MKAHIIVSTSQENRDYTFQKLNYLMHKGCKRFEKEVEINKEDDAEDLNVIAVKIQAEFNRKIQLFRRFPAQWLDYFINQLDNTKFIFVDLNAIHQENVDYTDHHVYYLPSHIDHDKCNATAKLLYYILSFELVCNTKWSNRSKESILHYFNGQIQDQWAKLVQLKAVASENYSVNE